MNLKQAMAALKAVGNEKMKRQNINHGASANAKQFGVRRGEVRKIAKKIKVDHALAMELWDTENIDARFLAVLIMKPGELSATQMDKLVRSIQFVELADWLNMYVLKKHADKEKLRVKWMAKGKSMCARAGWTLTAERISKSPDGLDIPALLKRIEAELANAKPEVQWTMNSALVNIGIHQAKHRKKVIAIAEKLGVYRDFPTSKGCTSPFAPIWIAKMIGEK
ncbi:DNA alkylation repair protein [Planctomycetota bacterium]|nr:DNA alkylation repair protein [Planctomycetota bacterium]